MPPEQNTDETQAGDTPLDGVSRRTLITAIGIAGAGAAGYIGRGAAQTPAGEFPIQGEDPLLKIRADRLVLVGRTSDPSSPDNGTLWYRSDL